MKKEAQIYQKTSYVRKRGYCIDIEIDMNLKYRKEKLKLTIYKNKKKLKEISGRFSNENFSQKVNDLYSQLYNKLTLTPKKSI